jgi:predicted amidohydrolase
MDLTSLLDLARDAPHESLVRLYAALGADLPARQQAASWTHEAGPGARLHVDDLLASLEAGTVPPPLSWPAHALTLLMALDDWCASQTLGERPTALSVMVDDVPWWVVPRPPHWTPRLARQPDQRQGWMRRHHAVPQVVAGIEVVARPMPPALDAALAESERLSAFAAGFEDGVEPEELDAGPKAFATDTVTDVETRKASVVAAMERAVGAQLIVFPELTLPKPCVDAVADRLDEGGLNALVTVAGSYHRLVGDRRLNLSPVLDALGQELWTHAKLMRIDIPEAHEAIDTGTVITLLVGSIGNLSVAICRDFCEATLASFWAVLAPDIVLVPSMGNQNTQSAHGRRAADLALRASTATVVANQPHATHRDSGVTPGGGVWAPRYSGCLRPAEDDFEHMRDLLSGTD